MGCLVYWKRRRQDKKTELYWKQKEEEKGLTSWEKYQQKWNFKETDYGPEPSNNGLDLMHPKFAFDTKSAKYWTDDQELINKYFKDESQR